MLLTFWLDIETDVGVAAEMTGGASHACFRGLTLGQAYQYHFGTDLWFRKRQLDGDVVAREHERSMRVDIEANLVPVRAVLRSVCRFFVVLLLVSPSNASSSITMTFSACTINCIGCFNIFK